MVELIALLKDPFIAFPSDLPFYQFSSAKPLVFFQYLTHLRMRLQKVIAPRRSRPL